MKVKGLDHKMYTWTLVGYEPSKNDTVPRSSYHLRARALLKRVYPLDKILEEVPLPGSGGLRADFVIISRRLIVEVHGEQHYKFIQHFHGTNADYLKAAERDAIKNVWCEINNLRLVALPYNEDDETWRRQILNIM